MGVPETWLQTAENDDCCQFPILPLEAVTQCRELRSLLLRHQANDVTHFSRVLEQRFSAFLVPTYKTVISILLDTMKGHNSAAITKQ